MHFNSKDRRLHLFDYVTEYKDVKLNQEQVQMIENTDLLFLREKLAFMQLMTNTRMTIEVGYATKSILNSQTGIYEKTADDIAKLDEFLSQLPYPFRMLEFFKKSRNEGYFEKYKLFMVSASDYIDKYIGNYWHTFTEYEIGLMYGYPNTAILAYVKMLERYPSLEANYRLNYTTAMEYIGCGIYSKQFFEQEKAYYEKIWEQIRLISPKLVEQAEKEHEEEKQRIKEHGIKVS